jgi:protein-tyrosine phosphatase
MRAHCPQSLQHKLRLFLDFSATHRGEGVPDPYYGGAAGFDHVLDLIEHGSAALIDALK